MKNLRIILQCVYTLFLMFHTSNAQNYNNESFDIANKKHTLSAGALSLVADKNVLELGEVAMLTVRINWTVDVDNAVPEQFDYRFEDLSKAPWKITKWEILEGGGELRLGSENYYAAYTAPSTMPANKYATIAVTLMPQDPTKPKVQLLQTIYIQDNDNIFYFDCPYLGIHAEKYVIKNNGGAFVKSDAALKTATDKKITEAQQKALQYTMSQASAQISASEAGFDLTTLTSNAKAIYVKDEKMTTIIINDNKVDMVNGQKSNAKTMYSITLTFPGKGAGSFKIKTNKKISAAITLPKVGLGYGCTCTDDPENPEYFTDDPPPHPSCGGGNITITKCDGKTIEGYVNALLESANPNTGEKFFSTLSGKFKVPIANQ
ncbi:MAG TPA: hypothetical protein PK431_08825 [Chitinophagales bacterium]|nr:hypothetical protein [Chitinophagales bacterium]